MGRGFATGLTLKGTSRAVYAGGRGAGQVDFTWPLTFFFSASCGGTIRRMSFSLIYLVNRFFYRIWRFIYNWYVGGFLAITHTAIDLFERLDRIFAFSVTLRNIYQPLYQDRTVLGFVLGVVFRLLRVLVGGFLYLVIFLITILIITTIIGGVFLIF